MTDQNAPKIMVVEDEISVSMELEEMLTENGYRVPGVAVSGEEAITKARLLEPDLILMDIKLSGKLDGIDAAARIRSRMDIPSIFLTGHGEKELVDRAVKADPLGYIMKPLNEVQILAAIKIALGRMNRNGVRREATEIPERFMDFTDQEIRIAELLGEGRNNEDVANELGLSRATVNWHRKKIRKKLGIGNTKTSLMMALRTIHKG